MTDSENTTSDEAIVEADDEAVTASAPDRSADDAKAGVGSASEQADASEASQQQGVGSASEQPDASDSEPSRKARKSREGIVVSQKMDKTAVVSVVERVRHPKYNKFVLKTKKLYAHDETNDANVGDRVRVTETRPLSKLKRWRVSQVLERAK